MTDLSKAVFLSYASEDAEDAARICATLRAAGIEVWFDQSELRGGDAWDAAIRKQIRACALFVPIISRNSRARVEGYFRLEWKLAVDRSHLMAVEKAFLMPVVVDGTTEAQAVVPDKFREVQWTRLSAGDTPPAFVERVSRLLASNEDVGPASTQALAGTGAVSDAHVRAVPLQRAGVHPESPRSRSVLWWVVAAVGIAIIYFAVDRILASKRFAAGPNTALPVQSTAPGPSTIPDKSIAVLPFVDLSEKKDQEYFSDGLSEELIDLLTKAPDLRVPARTSSFFFKGKSEDIASIAQKLHVAHVLEGSVRKSGNTIRVTAQLIRADNGYHLWSETYDRELKDVFQVQDEIAGAVVSQLKLKLAPAQQTSSHRTSNTEAYNLYLLGRQFYQRGTLESFRRAADAYRKAIELDPQYAAAYAELAISDWFVADETGDAAGLQHALTAADKAVALAPDGADGYAARGYLRFAVSWDWAGAQADLGKALALDPGNSDVQLRNGTLLASLGRLPEGIAAIKKAIELDPLSSSAWDTLSLRLIAARQFANAHEAIRRALEIQPESSFALNDLGALALLEGKGAEALAVFRRVGEDAMGLRLTGTAMAEHALGHPAESQRALGEVIATHAQDSAYQIAEACAWRGEKDKAFDWLQRAYKQRDGGLSFIKIDLLLASLRGDARFNAMLRKMQLLE